MSLYYLSRPRSLPLERLLSIGGKEKKRENKGKRLLFVLKQHNSTALHAHIWRRHYTTHHTPRTMHHFQISIKEQVAVIHTLPYRWRACIPPAESRCMPVRSIHGGHDCNSPKIACVSSLLSSTNALRDQRIQSQHDTDPAATYSAILDLSLCHDQLLLPSPFPVSPRQAYTSIPCFSNTARPHTLLKDLIMVLLIPFSYCVFLFIKNQALHFYLLTRM